MFTTFGTLEKDGTISNEIKINLNELPSSDPIAFGYGISNGQRHARSKAQVNHGSNFRELAPEYLRGFLFGYRGILVVEGTKFRKGQEQSFYFHDKNVLTK